MTIDTKQLAADIARVLELDAKRTQEFWDKQPKCSNVVGCSIQAQPDRAHNSVMVALVPKENDRDYFAAAPLMADIIRRQQYIIAEMEKGLRHANHWRGFGEAVANQIAGKVCPVAHALELAEPLVSEARA